MASPQRSASVLLPLLILLLYWTTPSAQSHDPPSADLSALYRVKRSLPPRTREKVKETFQGIKDVLTVTKDILVVTEVLKNLNKFASLAPGGIGAFFSVINVVLAFIPQEDPVRRELKDGFSEVNRKLDSLSIKLSNLATDVEWFNYASVYSQDEIRILNAWNKFIEFFENSELVQSEDDKLRLAEIFTNYYEYTSTEASVANFYHYLTVRGTSLSGNLNDLLIKKFKCDITEIGKYNIYLNSLLWRGLALNEFYWKLVGFNQRGKEAERTLKFQKVYEAQSSAVDLCLDNYQQYMKDDVVEITKAYNPDNKQTIAAEVKKFLDRKYNWYNWVVLVYQTDQDPNFILLDMTKIPVGTVTVAVGHTLKANEEHRGDVITAAKRCFERENCQLNQDQIGRCKHQWHNVAWGGESDVFRTIYLKNYAKVPFASYNGEVVQVPAPLEQIQCKWSYNSKLSVHYSRRLSVCNDENVCMNGGKCKQLGDSNDWLCECKAGYDGKFCESPLDTSVIERMKTLFPSPTNIVVHTKLGMIESKLQDILNTVKAGCRG